MDSNAGRMGRTRESYYRGVQDTTRRLGPYDRRRSVVSVTVEKRGNYAGGSKGAEDRSCDIRPYADIVGGDSKQEKRRCAMKKAFMAFFHRFACKEERRQLAELKLEREQQEKRLEEITKAALDGETDWFVRRVLREDPVCTLRVIDECHKENK